MIPSLNAALTLACHAATLLIAPFEGDKHTAYQDANGIWTIGYGHTGPEVHPGLTWNEAQAIAALTHDALNSEHDIINMVHVKLNQNEFDALVSFDYNLGAVKVESSTLLRKLNAGDRQGAADEMLRWVQPGSANQKGLTARRTAERALFLKPC